MAKIKFGKDDSYDNVKKTLQEALKENNIRIDNNLIKEISFENIKEDV